MPWSETTKMRERVQFIGDLERELFSMSELCQRYGISRVTGYKWSERYQAQGLDGLKDRSRAPISRPYQTRADIVELLAEARRHHPSWGPKKLISWLSRRYDRAWPAVSTAGQILKRLGLVKDRRRRPRVAHPGRPVTDPIRPNQLWTADYKGQFRTRDARYCYPLTVADLYSRYLLGCRALTSTKTLGTRSAFQRLFHEYGLPEAIRTDNGNPFSSASAIGRISRLSVWWIRLGIRPELTQPSHPEQNGSHERMHRTLKAETTRPPSANRAAQQRTFERFRHEYNHERPHEHLDQKSPSQLYTPSPRPYPDRLPEPQYPGHFEIRRVSRNGGIRWKKGWVNVSHTLLEENVGLEEVDDGVWSLYFGPLLLGRFHENELKLRGARLD
jgi:transposase InsO family protein